MRDLAIDVRNEQETVTQSVSRCVYCYYSTVSERAITKEELPSPSQLLRPTFIPLRQSMVWGGPSRDLLPTV